MKNKITYTLLLFLVLGSTNMIGQRNNRQQRQMPPTGGEYVLDGNGLVVEDEIPDFTFVSNSSSFNNAVNNEIALKIARDKEKDAWFHKQREIIKEHLENKFNKTFANYDAAKNEMFLYSEKANIVRNKVSPKSKYDQLHSQGYQRTLTYLKDLKLLALRSAEIQAGNIHNSQYGYITVNNVALKDMQNSNSINQHRNTVLIPLENNIATTHTNKHIALKIGNLGSAFEQKMVQQKNNYYYSFNEWDELNYMQFLINYEEIKRLTSVPYYYPQLLQLFDKFKNTDQATSPAIENYAIQNRGGGYSIFSQNHFQSLLASAQNNMGQYVDSSDLYASVVEAWEREKEMALESLLNATSTSSFTIQNLIAELNITDTNQQGWLYANTVASNNIIDFLNDNRVNGIASDEVKNLAIDITSIYTGLDTFEKDIELTSFNALENPWLRALREYAEELEYLRNKIPEVIWESLNQYLDEQLSSVLTKVALKLNPDAHTDSELIKNYNLEYQAKKAVGNLLFDFANGEGPDIREIREGDFWEQFFAGDRIDNIKNDFQNVLDDKDLTFDQFVANDDELESSYQFSPDHAGVIESFQEHLNANWVQFFVGGSRIEYRPSSLPDHIDVVLINPTSRNSLLLHIGDNYERDGSGNNVPLSTIEQHFYITIKID